MTEIEIPLEERESSKLIEHLLGNAVQIVNLHSHLRTQQCKHLERKKILTFFRPALLSFGNSLNMLLLKYVEQLHLSHLPEAGPKRAANGDVPPFLFATAASFGNMCGLGWYV